MTAATENGGAAVKAETETSPEEMKLEDTKPADGTKPAEETKPAEVEPKINTTTEEKVEKKCEVIDTDGVEVDAATSSKIMKQLEYYFGDRNLVKDRFMLREVTLDEGWISLDTMLNFKRLAGICSDKAKIAKSVETSNSDIVVIHESKSKIRRNPEKPLPNQTDDAQLANNLKTVYVKGLPITLTLDEAEQFMAPHGKTLYIKFRKDAQSLFKGSIFAEFAEQSDCDKFLKLENVKYGDATEPLLIMSRNDYFKSKNQTQKNDKNEKREAQLGGVVPQPSAKVPEEITYEKGMVVKISGLEGKETSREDMKDLFDGQGLKWVTYNKGDAEAFVRFDNDAAAILDKVKTDGKFILSELELEATVLAGDAEEEYYKAAAQEKTDFFNRKRRSERGGRGGRGKRYRRN